MDNFKLDILTAKFIKFNEEGHAVLEVLIGEYKSGKPYFERRVFNDKLSKFNPVEHIKNPKYLFIGVLSKPGTQITSSQDANDCLKIFEKAGWELDEEDINNIRFKKLKKIFKN